MKGERFRQHEHMIVDSTLNLTLLPAPWTQHAASSRFPWPPSQGLLASLHPPSPWDYPTVMSACSRGFTSRRWWWSTLSSYPCWSHLLLAHHLCSIFSYMQSKPTGHLGEFVVTGVVKTSMLLLGWSSTVALIGHHFCGADPQGTHTLNDYGLTLACNLYAVGAHFSSD